MRIVIDNIDIDYPDNLTIQIKRTNPFFENKKANEGSSYSFSMKKTPVISRLLAKSEKKKYDIKIFVESLIFVRGYAVINSEKDGNVSINIIEQGTDFRQKTEKTPLSDLKLDEFTIYEETDSATDKIDKWYDHMVETTLNQSVEEGSHKFPMIRSNAGYGEDGTAMLNGIFDNVYQRTINAYFYDDYVKNNPVPNSFTGAGAEQPEGWFVTVSPCVRISYVLDQVIKHFEIADLSNRLDEIVEFKQMYSFSGRALDEVQVVSGNHYNVHGAGFNLVDFLPDNNVFALFELLSEVFDAYFIYIGNELSIRIKSDVFKQKPIDLSIYCTSNFNDKKNVSRSFLLSYEIDEEKRSLYKGLKYSSMIGNFVSAANPFSDLTINNDFDSSTEEIRLKHVPLNSNWFLLQGVFDNYPFFAGGNEFNTVGWDEWSSRAIWNYPVLSDHYAEIQDFEKPTTWNYGFLRGYYDTRKDVYDDPPTMLLDTLQVPHMFNYNFMQLQIADDSLAAFADYMHIFGTSSAFLGGDDNTYNKYKRAYIDFIKNSREIEKELFLPAHKVNEITSFKEPKHIIKQRNLSFVGIAKEASFTLSKRGVSSTKIVYVVKSNPSMNEFNDDFNDDFSN